jgi:hypothetical protein
MDSAVEILHDLNQVIQQEKQCEYDLRDKRLPHSNKVGLFKLSKYYGSSSIHFKFVKTMREKSRSHIRHLELNGIIFVTLKGNKDIDVHYFSYDNTGNVNSGSFIPNIMLVNASYSKFWPPAEETDHLDNTQTLTSQTNTSSSHNSNTLSADLSELSIGSGGNNNKQTKTTELQFSAWHHKYFIKKTEYLDNIECLRNANRVASVDTSTSVNTGTNLPV